MKLIIDIPETMIQELKDGCFGVKHNVYELAGCIMNGIPLDDVNAEIEDYRLTIDRAIEEGRIE